MRELIPGHRDPFDSPSSSDFMYTCPRAEILDVDAHKGTCVIQFEATMGQRNDVGILIPYLSYNKKSPDQSSWIRVMPQIGDMVLVNFDPNGTPYIIGYDTIHYETLQNLNPADYPGFIFRELKQGEIELRSSGMAGLFLSRGGTCRISAGDQTRTLFRNIREEQASAGLSKLTSDYTVIRMGDAKRKELSTDFQETGITDDFGNQMKEVSFKVSQNVTLVERPVVNWSVGNVVNETLLGAEELKASGNPVRHHMEIFDTLGLTTVFEDVIDNQGNALVEFGALATSGFQISGKVSPVIIDNKSLDWSCLTGINLSTKSGGISATAVAGDVELKTAAGTANIDGLAGVKLGSATAAVHPVIKGELLVSALTAFGIALNGYAAALESVAPGTSSIMSSAVSALLSAVSSAVSLKTFTE